jgi:predicted Na+-dependent transporter
MSTLGTWLILAAVLLALGGALIGYAISVRSEPGRRKVTSLATGQRNLAAALLIAAHAFGGDTFVATVVACFALTITMHLIAAEWGRLTPDVAVEA